jgi:DNA primase
MAKFDIEKLKLLSIDQVLSALGLEPIRNSKKYACPNNHTTPTPLSIYSKNNVCKCHNCDQFKGGPIDVTMLRFDLDFVGACEWLHEAFSIPYLSGEQTAQKARPIPKPAKKKIEYMTFDVSGKYASIELRRFYKDYHKMTTAQRLKMVYTFLYRYSAQGDHKAKYAYYGKERGISSDNRYIKAIGYLNQKQLKYVVDRMRAYFPEKDLLEFGILKERDGENKFVFHYVDRGGLLFVPSFDLYSDMVTGFMVRPTHPPKWMKTNGVKELQLSKTDIIKPLPFGLSNNSLRKNNTFYLTEGHMDLASIPGNTEKITRAGVASPGTHGFTDEMLGLFRGKKVVLVYDQDMSGKKAEFGYTLLKAGDIQEEYLENNEGKQALKERIKELNGKNVKFDTAFYRGMKQRLLEAGIRDVSILEWDKNLGGDLNDLMINGNLDKVFPKGENDG